jgi:hypothetical protein
LCARHDRELFAPIETQPLDLSSDEHRVLLALRATLYEVHATATAGVQVHSMYQKRSTLGLDPTNDISVAGLFATQRLMIAYETYMYMSEVAKAYAERAFDEIVHDVKVFEVNRPTLAASVLFSLDSVKAAVTPRVCMTVLPLSQTRSALLLSYLRRDAKKARKHLWHLRKAAGEPFKRELSRRLLNHAQNFVLSPSYVAGWPDGKKDVLITYFMRTVFTNDLSFDHPDLILFE